MYSLISRFGIALFLLLTASALANAMTVYDVIQLSNKSYSDQDIIALIETTDSAFELEADDITRLVELGVSEPVIQAMLKAVPAEPPAEPAPATTPGKYSTHSVETTHDRTTRKYSVDPVEYTPGSGTAIAYIASEKPVPGADINSEPLAESGSGGHHHQVVTLAGIRLFVLRDEGSYPSVAARTRAVVDRLRTASTIDGGQFQAVHVEGRDTVMYTADGTTQTVMVISVSARDARAWQRRSGRRVTSDLLAAYWSDLLSDYWSLALGGQPPDRLASLHEGEALQELYDRLDTSIDNKTDRLTGAFQALPKQEQQHLLQLAESIPREFSATDEHTGETP